MTSTKAKTMTRVASAAAFVLASAVSTSAQEYPNKPIDFVVGFSPGGFADTMGRILAQGVSERLGQPVVVENQSGASGNNAAASVAAADPDGYTVLVTTSSLGLAKGMGRVVEFSLEDLAPVAIPVSSAETLAAHPSVPATNLDELLTWAKDQESVTLANAGVGTGSQVSMAYFLQKVAGLENLVEVGYRGGSNARQAAIAGEVQLIGSSNSVYPVIREGLLNGIAVAAAEPIGALPETQTFVDQGYDDFVVSSWVGLFVPADTDPAIQQALNDAVNDMLNDPEVMAKFEQAGVMVDARNLDDTKAFFAKDTESWATMINALGIGD